jgi:hypothetical protein
MDEQKRREHSEHSEHGEIDLTTVAPESDIQNDGGRGSAWAQLDETFFRVVQDVFPRQLCFGMGVLLASNDELVAEVPLQRTASPRLTHEETLARLNAEIDRELEIRRAMRRHPSRRRF